MSNDFVKVPYHVEREGGTKTFFLPDCHLPNGKYRVGPKKGEKLCDDYWQALSHLMSLAPPRYFRRPNKEGAHGGVKSLPDEVEEVKRSYIEEMIANLQSARS